MWAATVPTRANLGNTVEDVGQDSRTCSFICLVRMDLYMYLNVVLVRKAPGHSQLHVSQVGWTERCVARVGRRRRV